MLQNAVTKIRLASGTKEFVFTALIQVGWLVDQSLTSLFGTNMAMSDMTLTEVVIVPDKL